MARRRIFGRKLAARASRTAAGDTRADADRRHPARDARQGRAADVRSLPVPNYFFMRDPQVVIGDGVVICGMATQARRRESLLSKYVFGYHPLFRDSGLLDRFHGVGR